MNETHFARDDVEEKVVQSLEFSAPRPTLRYILTTSCTFLAVVFSQSGGKKFKSLLFRKKGITLFGQVSGGSFTQKQNSKFVYFSDSE